MKTKKDKPPKLPKEPKAKKLSLRDEMKGLWSEAMHQLFELERRLIAVEEKAGIAGLKGEKGDKGEKGEPGLQGDTGKKGGFSLT